jgi:zinc transport system substrate-binding protein
MVKKMLLAIIAVLCGFVTASVGEAAVDAARPRVRILASTFPVYLFTKNVAAGAEGVVVEPMLPASMGCPHDYVLTPADMEKISRADIFVANGLGLEEFLGAPLERANPKVVLVDSSLGIEDVLESGPHEHAEETSKGHKHDHKQEAGKTRQKPPTRAGGHQHDHDGEDRHEHVGPNPHLFASPRMAAKMVRNISSALAKADRNNAELYRRNGAAYGEALEKLAEELSAAGRTLKNRKIITQHAVFDYLARDMGLEIAAVVQEDPGMEPSAAEMLQLVRVIRQQKVGALFTEPQYPAKVGEAIAKEAKIPVGVLDPAATGTEDAPLDHYQQVMRQNLETMKAILGSKGD